MNEICFVTGNKNKLREVQNLLTNYKIVSLDDLNKNGQFDKFEDRIVVGGASADKKWGGTVFIIDFSLASEATFPKSDDIFRVKFMRPFWKTDNLKFTINSYEGLDEDSSLSPYSCRNFNLSCRRTS